MLFVNVVVWDSVNPSQSTVHLGFFVAHPCFGIELQINEIHGHYALKHMEVEY